MRIDDIIYSDETREEMYILRERCTQFLNESQGSPLLMNLPRSYGDFHKVKVRKRKHRKEDNRNFAETFNEAFEEEMRDLRERAVFANGIVSFEPTDSNELEPFYVFPIDEYRFMYSGEIENSSHDYKAVFDVLFEEFGADRGNEVITDLLKFSYTTGNLGHGILEGSEIILFNLPYFYAIRATTVDSYENLLTNIESM